MIYKAIGTLLLLLAGGYLSVSVSRYERRRLLVLDAYLSLIYHIKGQIDCYAMPIRDILAMADPALLSACLGSDDPETAADILPALLALPDSPLPALVEESRLYLNPEAERLLASFAHELGATHRSDQVARCDYYITVLGEERRRLIEVLPARMRVGSTLCLCAAVGAAVLLW